MPYRQAQHDPPSYSRFRTLGRYDRESQWSMHDAGLEAFSWLDSDRPGGGTLTMKFGLAYPHRAVVFTYAAAALIADTGLSTDFQSLYVEALGYNGGTFRHEFLFHNAVLIVESQGFDFSIEQTD